MDIPNEHDKDELQAAVRRMVRSIPALQPMVREHEEDNDGEILSHVILSNIVRWAGDHIGDDASVARAVVEFLNREYGHPNPWVKNLVIVSGVEMLPNPGETGEEMVDWLTPQLRAMDPWGR